MPVDDDGDDDLDEARPPLLPPEDRLWRHPSELIASADRPPEPERATAPAPVGSRSSWGLAVVAGLTGAVLTAGLLAVVGGVRERVVEREVVEKVAVQSIASGGRSDSGVVAIAEDLRPSIVRIDVVVEGVAATGSGVIFRDSGELLTNAHVVDGADSIDVMLADGSHLSGDVVGVDHLTDIAVVRLDAGDRKFSVAIIGTAAELKVGEPAMAIGSPLGLAGGPSVTTGVISALGRRLDNPDGEPLHDLIQTDAPIAAGSSGGALVNTSGAVIGITTVIAVGSDGAQFGFAVPIDVAHDVAEDILAWGKALHVWLGVEGTDLPADDASDLDVTGGARVRRVMAAGPAGEAGLRGGDVIVAIDGVDVTSMSGLIVALRAHDPGDVVPVTYVRDGERATVDIALEERPAKITGG